ncbi:TIGR04141 family sporadically distributed protein [Lentzea sp. NPDC034063]|uniref:TIGR04141 family sporadically distributed protein n=1 Tax=unclassified Lentzea TaxID=2643253 RepID=UPI00340AEE7A
MAKALPTGAATVYRLPATHENLSDYLKDVEGVDVRYDGELLIAGTRTHVFAGVRSSGEPNWVRHLTEASDLENLDLAGSSPFALIVVEIDDEWVCAVTWGSSSRFMLDELLLDDDFGLNFGIRRIDPDKVRTIRSNLLDVSARGMEVSFPSGSSMSGFPLEPAGELVTGIEGPADLSGLTYDTATDGRTWNIRAGRGLNIQLGRTPETFIADLRTICAIVDEDVTGAPLRHIAEIRPVSTSNPVMPTLENQFAAALGGDDQFGPLGVCWPSSAIREIGQAQSFVSSRVGPTAARVLVPGFEIHELVEPFTDVDQEFRLDVLRSAELAPCEDELGAEPLTRPISMIKWVAFQTVVEGKTYALHQGKWYEIGEGAVARVREQVRALLENKSSLTFPVWVPTGKRDDEHQFARKVAKQSGYLCMDRGLAYTPMHLRGFEIADIFGPGNEIVHMKWLGRATAASHLYTQAQVSAWAQYFEPQAMQQLRDKVRALDSTRDVADRPTVVVLAIAGRAWDVSTLFTLSQVSLLRLSHELRGLGIELQFADIPFIAKTKGKSAGNAA